MGEKQTDCFQGGALQWSGVASSYRQASHSRSALGNVDILYWNVEGLVSRLWEPGFLNYILSFHICCLVETFTSEKFDFSTYFSDHLVFHSPAVKLSHRGRRSGGVVILVKKNFHYSVLQVPCNYDSMLALRIMNYALYDIVLLCVYIPPVDSPYYKDKDVKCNILLLEDEILKVQEIYPDSTIMICGDLNARTGNWNLHTDDVDNADSLGMGNCACPQSVSSRRSQDCIVNQFGEILKNLCKIHHLFLLNGSIDGDGDGKFTYLSQHGNSVIDYCLLDDEAIANSLNFQISNMVDSSHMPLEIKLGSRPKSDTKTEMQKTISRLYWDKGKLNEMLKIAQSTDFGSSLSYAYETIDTCVDSALQIFNQTLIRSADCMRHNIKLGRPVKRRNSEWYDQDCRAAKRKAKKALVNFRKTKLDNDKELYIQCRSTYKVLIREKKREYETSTCNALLENINNSNLFWSLVRQKTYRRIQQPEISIDTWKCHFENILTRNRNSCSSLTHEMSEKVYDEMLDAPMNAYEIKQAIARLKSGKATGLDEIPGELLKAISGHILPFLTKYFNVLYESQNFPQEWSRSIIIPIYKTGDKLDPTNYRGISLLSVVSKLFTSVLTHRLRKWVEEKGKVCVEQAGFRSGHSTIDHVFTLHSMILKHVYGGGRGKLFVAFVDYKKAFDSVDRTILWSVLGKTGLSTKFISMFKAIYANVQACVRWKFDFSDFFDCPTGTRQGALESPIMFSLYITFVADFVREHGKHGVQMLSGMAEIFFLIFADDLVLLSTSPVGLQTQINNLSLISSRLGLEINTAKTKVMVFRRGGFLAQGEKWFLKGNELEVVNSYKYLGYMFTTKLSVTAAVDNLSVQAKKKTVQLLKTMYALHSLQTKVFFRLFDAQVQPALLYCSELWGLSFHQSVEKAHLFACKRFLNVDTRTPNSLVYAELGRFPLILSSTVRAVKYWLKLSKLPAGRLPKQAYLMLLNSCIPGRLSWAKSVEDCLCKLGYAYIWHNQGVPNERSFLRNLKLRLQDCYCQEWHSKIGNSDRFIFYSSFKSSFECERYLNFINVKKFRDAFIRFRFGVNELRANKIFVNEHHLKLNCPSCRDHLETEEHFLLRCPLYNDLRSKYLNQYLNSARPNVVSCLIDGQEIKKTRSVAMYVYYALKLRSYSLEVN